LVSALPRCDIGETNMVAQQNQIPTGEGLTLEKLWAYLDASREQAEQRRKESEREWAELREIFKETGHQIDLNRKEVGGLGRRFGKLVEHLVGPGIVKRFGEQGYHFDGIKKQRYKITGEEGDLRAEIDLLLENDDTVIAVEVKSRPDTEENYLERHLRRLEIMHEHRKEEGWEGKRILGAIAGAIFDIPAKKATLKAGLFVIVQSGDTMRMEVPEGFKPRVW